MAKGLTAALALAVVATVVLVAWSAFGPQPAHPTQADSERPAAQAPATPSATEGEGIVTDTTGPPPQPGASVALEPQRAVVAFEASADIAAAPPRIVGRAVDPTGAPLASARLRAVLRGFDWMPVDFFAAPATVLRTDGEGRFEWTPEESFDQRWESVLRTRIERREHVAVFTVEPMQSGTLDVGDVRLELPPLVVAGRLVDDTGQPVSRGTLRVVAVTGESDAGATWIEGSVERDGTIDVRQFPAPEASEGRRFELHVEARGHGYVAVPFEIGSDLGVVVVARQGAIHGSLVLDPAWRSTKLYVRVRRLDGELEPPRQTSGLAPADPRVASLSAAGEFRFDDLPTGRYDLHLDGPTWVGPYLPLWSDVAVETGAAPISVGERDLRGSIARTVVRVRDASGEPVGGIRVLREVRWAEAVHTYQHGISSRGDGEFHFFHVAAGASVTLLPPQAMRVVVPCDGREHSVELRSAPSVRLTLVGAERLTSNQNLGVAAWQRDTRATVTVQPTGEGGVWSFAAPALGPWEISASVHDTLQGADGLVNASLGTIDVLASPAVQSFELTLPAELFAPADRDR